MGTSFIVGPSAFHESDDIDKSELNTQRMSKSFSDFLICSIKLKLEILYLAQTLIIWFNL